MAVVEVSESDVRALADDRSFARGQAYVEAGRVRRVTVDGTSVTATVDGTAVYRVRLEIAASGLDGRCSCPYGQEGVFCKHCVATALSWLDSGAEIGEPRRGPVTDQRLRGFLRRQDPAWLAEQLLTATRSDPLLKARLDVAAGADAKVAYDDRALRARLEDAIEIGDYIDYGTAFSYFQGVDAALDEVAALVDGGFPDAAAALIEYALELLEATAGLIDDSDGGLGAAVHRAEEIHLAACEEGQPDPVQLAELLAERASSSDYELFLDALPDYEPVLGTTGMARYQELVEQAWRDLPPRTPNDYTSRRFVVGHLRERLAECTGGADALIDVLTQDVTSGYDVLRIAQRLCAEGRDDEALGWLERGMAEFSPDNRLRSLAAECHVRCGRRAEAGELRWANFVDAPSLADYVALHDDAADLWPEWRDRALELLRKEPASAERFTMRPYYGPPGHSTLVEALLWEGDEDAAWQAAVDGGCRDDLWLRLARRRAADHPDDAIPVLLAAADQAIGQKNRASYQFAAGLLAEAATLYSRLRRENDFAAHMEALRTEHRPKRALREELDKAELP